MGKVLFKEVNKQPEKDGLMLREGCIVDAPTISAFSSTKSESGQRDRIVGPPEMHIGVDDALGLTLSLDATAANVHDIVPAGNLFHVDERRVFGDAGYLGIQKRDEHKNREYVS
jgi:IS5 family transposase